MFETYYTRGFFLKQPESIAFIFIKQILTNSFQKEDDDYTFSNTVVWNSEVNNTNINRELVLLDFKCIYQDEYTIETGDAIPTIR